jgi:hypothetical protein
MYLFKVIIYSTYNKKSVQNRLPEYIYVLDAVKMLGRNYRNEKEGTASVQFQN